MSITIGERLATLEERVENIIDSGDQRERKQDEILEELRAAKNSFSVIEKEILRYKGFFGGIVFLASCISVFLYKFGAVIWKMVLSAKTGN